MGPSMILALFKEGPNFSPGTFQDFGLFQGRSGLFPGDLPGFQPFSRKVQAFLGGPSRISALFKEGPGFFVWTFQDFGDFQGRSGLFPVDLPRFRPFSRKVRAFSCGPSKVSALFKEGPDFFLGTFQDFGLF